MENIQSVQELINKKARKRAGEEMQVLIKTIHSNSTLQQLLDKVYINLSESKQDSMRSAFWSIESSIPKRLIDELTKIYIPQESKLFVDRIDKLSNELEQLKSSI
jgi:hypothetical protein